ncbi:MAG: GGDEF domain-containing protein [Variibacter sp.]|nr:GGDEF domain-containing protein [Variibacter sp.]
MPKPQKQSSLLRGTAAGPRGAGRRPAANEGGARVEWMEPPLPAEGAALLRRLAAEIEALKAELAAERARARELELRADIDGLLDILNRRGFERELKRSIAFVKRYRTPAALVYLDLDRFKPINDTYGHAAGDAVLRAAAAALAQSVRASDVVGRLGGDELAVLLWNVTPATAAAKAVALERVVSATTVEWRGIRLSVGASAGVAMLEPEDDPVRAIARADRAMYARKRARRAEFTR